MDDAEAASLARARASAEELITWALIWVDRFRSKMPEALISSIGYKIQILVRAMQGRSITDIRRAFEALLAVQSAPELRRLEGPTSTSHLAGRTTRAPDEPWVRPKYFPREEARVPTRPSSNGSVFVSYSKHDEYWLRKVLVHLRPLERSCRIRVWHDGNIAPGTNWTDQIDNELSVAACAVLLVSANFMASEFIFARELPPLARRARANGVIVFPVMVGYCLFDEDDFLRDFQHFNDPRYPLCSIPDSDVDKTLVELARSVRKISEATKR